MQKEGVIQGVGDMKVVDLNKLDDMKSKHKSEGGNSKDGKNRPYRGVDLASGPSGNGTTSKDNTNTDDSIERIIRQNSRMSSQGGSKKKRTRKRLKRKTKSKQSSANISG
jgi:hypothetical protein